MLGPSAKRGRSGETFSVKQFDVPYRFGGTRDVEVTFAPFSDADGEVDGSVALIEDISVERLLELQRVEILELMSDAFLR